MAHYFIGIDQGTTGTTVLLLDDTFNVKGSEYTEHRQIYPHVDWVEHDPVEIWEKIQKTVQQLIDKADIQKQNIRSIGLDNQGETVVVWNCKTGQPLYNAIVWQDKRTSMRAEELQDNWSEYIKTNTGLVLDSYFSALKIEWILNTVDPDRQKCKNGEIYAGTSDAYFLWKMTEGKRFITDASTASRTMLYNIKHHTWDEELLRLFNIPKHILPDITDSVGMLGEAPSLCGSNTPVGAAMVDQMAALAGQSCFKKGMLKTTYGTGCFMIMNLGNAFCPSAHGLITSIAWQLNGEVTYAFDGGVYVSGAAVQWLRDKMHLIQDASELPEISKSLHDTGGVYFVPAFYGLAAPTWDAQARGTIVGITATTTREHIIRATVESSAFQVNDVLVEMEKDAGMSIEVMRADGGAVRDDFLMQFQADISNIPIDVPEITETTSLGAAYFASLGVGHINSLHEIEHKWKLAKRYEPSMSQNEREDYITNWKRAVGRAIQWKQT